MSAGELARAIRSGQASSREVVEAHLRRIEEVNPRLNALVAVLAESALAAAAAADRAVASGAPLGALHGVPISVKENIDVAELPTTHGVAVRSASSHAPRACTESRASVNACSRSRASGSRE